MALVHDRIAPYHQPKRSLKGRLHRVDAVLEVAALASVHVSRDSALDVARLAVIGLAQVDEHVIG